VVGYHTASSPGSIPPLPTKGQVVVVVVLRVRPCARRPPILCPVGPSCTRGRVLSRFVGGRLLRAQLPYSGLSEPRLPARAPGLAFWSVLGLTLTSGFKSKKIVKVVVV